MRRRIVITRIDDISELFKDYLPGYVPRDARPVRLMYKPSERGRLAIEFVSDQWEGSDKAIEVKFDLRRNFLVGGGKS